MAKKKRKKLLRFIHFWLTNIQSHNLVLASNQYDICLYMSYTKDALNNITNTYMFIFFIDLLIGRWKMTISKSWLDLFIYNFTSFYHFINNCWVHRFFFSFVIRISSIISWVLTNFMLDFTSLNLVVFKFIYLWWGNIHWKNDKLFKFWLWLNLFNFYYSIFFNFSL